jgi:hypothetical protein
MAVQTQIQTRRGTAASWTSTNPTLAAGEIGFESDTNKFKIGTGSTAWASLAYASNVSPLTTKGDLYTYSTDNTRLAVGANGETIVADSSTSTGLRWNAGNYVNAVYNSSFDIWQRGTSFVPAAYNYGADRWSIERAGSVTGSTVSRQAAGLDGFRYCARIQRDSGNTSVAGITILQTLETSDAIEFAGKTVTFSFYGRKGANYSDAGSDILVNIPYGTGTDQPLQSFTGFAFAAQENKVLTTTWQRFTMTFSVPSTATEIGYYFAFTPVGTAGAADYFEITGVQLEVGSVATTYQRQNATIQGELAACQRYFYRYNAAATTGPLGVGSYYGSTTLVLPIQMKQTMRTAPSATFNNPTNFTAYSNGAARAATGMSLDIANTDVYSVTITTSAATAGNAASVNAVQTNASIDFSSEL